MRKGLRNVRLLDSEVEVKSRVITGVSDDVRDTREREM